MWSFFFKLCQVLVVACGTFVVLCRIFHCSTWTLYLWLTGSVVAVLGLRCSVACEIFVPWPGIEPVSPALQGVSSTTGHQGNPLISLLIMSSRGEIMLRTNSKSENGMESWIQTSPLNITVEYFHKWQRDSQFDFCDMPLLIMLGLLLGPPVSFMVARWQHGHGL